MPALKLSGVHVERRDTMAVKVHNKYFTHMIQSPRTKPASAHETRRLFRTKPTTPHGTRELLHTKPTTPHETCHCFTQNQLPRMKPMVPQREIR